MEQIHFMQQINGLVLLQQYASYNTIVMNYFACKVK